MQHLYGDGYYYARASRETLRKINHPSGFEQLQKDFYFNPADIEQPELMPLIK